MTTYVKNRVILVLLFLSICIASCSQKDHNHHSVYSNGVGFQYDLPSIYCPKITVGSNTLELYCPEGKVVIDIMADTVVQGDNQKFQEMLKGMKIPVDLYSFSIDQSSIVSDGNYQRVELARISKVDSAILEHNIYPYYVAISQFGPGRIFVASGFLYNNEFELRFSDIFLSVVKSFEPFTP
jgi:hypothetical protein